MFDIRQHQQQLLHEMGMISWIERTQHTCYCSSNIWRDNIAEKIPLNISPIQENINQAPYNSVLHHQHTKINKELPNEVSLNELVEISHIQPLHSDAESNVIINLYLELYMTESLLLIANLKDTDEHQQQLWRKIQQSLKVNLADTQHIYVKWSYTWLEQRVHPMIADYYLKGVLDYYTFNKTVFVLGELPFHQEDFKQQYHYHYFPSLFDLQQSEDLKRQLWQEIKKRLK